MKLMHHVAIVLVAGALAWPLAADAQACNEREARAAIEQAKQREAGGKLNDAVILYRHAVQVCPTSPAHAELQRLGRLFAARAEEQGRLHSGDRMLRVEADDACRKYDDQVGEGMKPETAFGRLPGSCEGGGRLTINERASAFAWLEETRSHGEADRVMVKLARTRSDDLGTFRLVAAHFEQRRRHGPAPAPERQRELEAIAADNVQRYLAAEDKEAPGLMRATLGDSAASGSLAELRRASEWERFVPESARRVAARAEQRGDMLAQAETPRFLREAVQYYRLAGNEAKVKQVASKAERLGDAAAQSGEYAAARQFFQLAGKPARATEMERRIEQQETGSRKNEDARRQKFKKEQDELEKELKLR